jgi:hypothetical protein
MKDYHIEIVHYSTEIYSEREDKFQKTKNEMK